MAADEPQTTPTRARVIMQLADLIEAVERPHPTRVAVDGPDAAGKTVLADEIADALADRGRCVIRASIDGFHRPQAERHRRGSLSPTGYFEDSFDYQQLRLLLLDPLGPGGDGHYQTRAFNYRLDRPELDDSRVAPADSVLVFDGVFLARPELASAWDFRIFVSCDFDESLRRAKRRDAPLFGSAAEVEARYSTRYIPAQQLYNGLRPAETADATLENTDPNNPVLHRQ